MKTTFLTKKIAAKWFLIAGLVFIFGSGLFPVDFIGAASHFGYLLLLLALFSYFEERNKKNTDNEQTKFFSTKLSRNYIIYLSVVAVAIIVLIYWFTMS